MEATKFGQLPKFRGDVNLPQFIWEACTGKGVDYPALYQSHFGELPGDWRLGIVDCMWTGFASDSTIRLLGASGGIITRVLIYLLEIGRVDGVVVARQGIPKPEEASWYIARTAQEILECAGSVYIPVPMLEALRNFRCGERYAMTCLPEQSAALRVLQEGKRPSSSNRLCSWALYGNCSLSCRNSYVTEVERSR